MKRYLYILTDGTLTMAYCKKLGAFEPYYLVKGKNKNKSTAHDDTVRKTIRLNGTV